MAGLFVLPKMSVSHYVEHKDADCDNENLYIVDRKADIPLCSEMGSWTIF